MKKFLITAVAVVCAFGAQADGDWKTTLGKVKDLSEIDVEGEFGA